MKNVFLSYSRQDLKFVQRFAQDLQQAGYDVWYDLTDLSGGDRWASRIQAAIDACDAFITVISPNSVTSEWVEKEFLYASHAEKNIVPVLYQQSRLPLWLLDMHYISIQGRDYKNNFPLVLAAIEQTGQPVVSPEPAKGWAVLSPLWIGGIVVGILLVLSAVFGVRALRERAGASPDTAATLRTLNTAAAQTLQSQLLESGQASASPGESVASTSFSTEPPPFTSTPTFTAGPVTEVAVTVTLAPVLMDSKEVEMLLIPAGIFYMGESPVRVVDLDAFYIDRYEVSVEQYKRCVEERGCEIPTNQRVYFNTRLGGHPVTYVNWNMANAYCKWRGARLPTDAEWEKAARGDQEPLEYPWGDEFSGKFANFCDTSCTAGGGKEKRYGSDGFENTAPVSSFEEGKSSYGVFNMSGNVAEWVADWYDPSYYADLPLQNPQGPDTGTLRVLRGGSWASNPFSVRVFARDAARPEETGSYIGFRCAADVAP